jgi:hypothetical protein
MTRLGAGDAGTLWLHESGTSRQLWPAVDPGGPLHIWTGADPTIITPGADPDSYTMGTLVEALADITVLGFRIWADPAMATKTSRQASLWGVQFENQLATMTIDEAAWSGWKTFELESSVPVTAGTLICASFQTAGGYGRIAGAFTGTAGYTSSDGAARMISQNEAEGTWSKNSNGRFAVGSTNSFPSGTFGQAFYGVDILYQPT